MSACFKLFRFLAFFAVTALATHVLAEPVITEFLASNVTNLPDEDGDYPDWIEIHNPDTAPVSLGGWYLTDNAKKKTKWAIPAVTIPAGGYLIVFASGKDRSDPGRPLHTNFSLDADGEYLGLIRPDGSTAATEFAPTFPPQHADISYGLTTAAAGATAALGYFASPTPGAPNGAADALILPEAIAFSRPAGPFFNPFTLELAGAGAGEHIRYVIAPPSANGAAVPAPTASSPEYTGPIMISASAIVRAAVFSSDDTMHGLPATAQFAQLGSNIASFTSNLPVLILDNHGLGPITKDGLDHPAWLYAYAAPASGATLDAPALAVPVTMNVHGNFTAAFPKQSYNLSLQTDLGRDDSEPLLGLDSSSDWAIISPWALDKSYIRDPFVYALAGGMGHWTPRTQFVEMFYNNGTDGIGADDYVGIGILTDRLKIGKDRIDIASLNASDVTAPAITGGYIVKLDVVPDPDHYAFITDHGVPSADGTAVVIESPSASSLVPAQRDYIRGYVQDMENALWADQASGYAQRTYRDYIDVPSWVDHHILELFVGNVDALYRSDYFYKDRNGKMVSGPAWDFDTTMGNGDDRNADWNTWDTASVDLWNYGWWGPLTHDPEFMQAWVDRWQSLRRTLFADASLRSLADSLAAQVGSAAAARDAARWVDNVSRFPGGYLGEVAHLEDWITHRAGWIDAQFVAAPTTTDNGSTLHIAAPAGAKLVYTLDGSDPRSLNGPIAPGALVSDGPIDIPDTANLHVRSYRAENAATWPGSPWSSAACTTVASPLSPQPRLVNLSSRGFVGAGEDALIAGVIVADTNAKSYLARGVGPGLAQFGTDGALPDPQLSVIREDGAEIYRNAGWQSAPGSAAMPALAKSVGAFPLAANSSDAAIAAQLGQNAYTLQLTSASGLSGVGLVELYDADGKGRTANLSTRGFVGTGSSVLIGGFVVQGPAYQRMLIRGVGPTLSAFGLERTLADPVITLYSGNTVVATNDRWGDATNLTGLLDATKAVGAFQLADGTEDAAMLITVPPGAYTVVVSGKNGGEGVALLEIYAVP